MKKLLLLLLALVMVLSLAACNTGKTPDDETTPDTNDQTTDPFGEDETDDPLKDDLPEKNYGKTEFNILTQDYHAAVTDFKIDESTTNEIEQLIYNRNAYVEERYNIVFEYFTAAYDQINTMVKTTVMSDSKAAYDLISARPTWTVLTLTEGNVGDWNELEYVDTERDWWNSIASEDLSVNGKNYILMGDINASYITHTHCILFNKKLATDMSIPDLFELVSNYEWTYETMYEMVKDIWIDSNDIKDLDDTYGFSAQEFSMASALQFSMNLQTTAKTPDGFPVMEIDMTKWTDAVTDVYTLLYDTPGVYADAGWSDHRALFSSGRALFVTSQFAHPILGTYSELTDEYAIIPYPMYDDQQEGYYTFSDTASSAVTYPINVADPEKTGIIAEALAAESLREVTPMIYEVALKYRYSTSEEQAHMVDLIRAGVRCEFGYVFISNSTSPRLGSVVTQQKQNNYTTYYQNYYRTWDTKLE